MQSKIMFVDDEISILSSLTRIFLDDNFEIYTAESGLKALEILKKTSMDLIVSDQRMLEMGGVEFLKQSKKYSPNSVRMVLTGYADITAAVDSINKGEVYRYISKPWDNNELKATVRDALEFGRLKKENKRLLELTKKQNLELKDLNANLEDKVEEQTKELRGMYDKLKILHDNINKSFMNTVMVLSNIISMKKGAVALGFKNTSKLAVAFAKELNISEKDKIELKIAALLHDIGLIGINDNLLNKAFDNMVSLERIEYKKHPIIGQAMLDSIENMRNVSVIVRHHHERWDGEGYPDNLAGEQIPIPSRIISIASDYEALINGTLMPSKFTNKEARHFIVENSGKRYEPKIVAVFVQILPVMEKKIEEKPEFRISSSELKAGMVLSKDILTGKGLLLIHEGVTVNETHIKSIIHFEKSEGKKYDICIVSKTIHS